MTHRRYAGFALLALWACAASSAAPPTPARAKSVADAAVARADRVAAAARKALVGQRARDADAFAQASVLYPQLPRGLLEAIAYVQTGWTHVSPARNTLPHDGHLPPAFGMMGLYGGEGFSDQVAAAAHGLGVSQDTVRRDPQVNILAGAWLLDRALRRADGSRIAIADADAGALAQALQAYSGLPKAPTRVAGYARDSFVYAVLTTLRDGVAHDGVAIAARPLSIERAFPPARLALLRAPALRMDPARDVVALASDDGAAIWNPASTSNYSTASNQDSAVIIHSMEGSYAGAIAWFQNPSAQVSAHYLLRKSDGQITQMVRESQQAWHAAYHNYYTIGIEHEGYANDPGTWTDVMVNASARLTSSICARRGVNCASAWQGPGYDTWHVVPDSVRVKGHGMLTSNQNRYDPGKYFPWARYYTLINGGAPPAPPANPLYWVDTYADASGYASPTSTAATGTLRAGTNYVYCKTWGREMRVGQAFNHWWLKTDLDIGPANQWVSAYYLSRWGNDEARDRDGFDIPRCDLLPYGEIGRKYAAIVGAHSVLGVPTLAEMDAKLGGRFQQFAQGIILWRAQTGSFAIHGDILDRFWATGGEQEWGYALADEAPAAASPASGQVGRFQYFEKGLFLWTPVTGAHVVHGAILDLFEDSGREARYGYPTGDEQAYGSDGRQQVFERATFLWTPQGGARVQ